MGVSPVVRGKQTIIFMENGLNVLVKKEHSLSGQIVQICQAEFLAKFPQPHLTCAWLLQMQQSN